ncbi:hypothetical protein HWV62_17354 [Athelia sp. TMB]|nr:hypothetical protein HWV62_17354 [Athelia sp. TMB]
MSQNTTEATAEPVAPSVRVTSGLSDVLSSALAAGATRSDITQTERHIYTPDGGMSVTCTQVTLTFFDPSTGSSCRSLYGGSIEEAAASLQVNRLAYRSAMPPPTGPPPTPATQPAPSLPTSPISLSLSIVSSDEWTPVGAPPSIPHTSASSPGAPLDLWSDSTETYAQSSRRARNIIRLIVSAPVPMV